MASGRIKLPPYSRAFAGQNAGVFIADFLVITVKITDFAAADTDIACRNVRLAADMAEQFTHEGLAESHDFAVGFAFGIEIGTALAAAHGQGGQGVFENLFKTQEFDDAQVDGRMKTQDRP